VITINSFDTIGATKMDIALEQMSAEQLEAIINADISMYSQTTEDKHKWALALYKPWCEVFYSSQCAVCSRS